MEIRPPEEADLKAEADARAFIEDHKDDVVRLKAFVCEHRLQAGGLGDAGSLFIDYHNEIGADLLEQRGYLELLGQDANSKGSVFRIKGLDRYPGSDFDDGVRWLALERALGLEGEVA